MTDPIGATSAGTAAYATANATSSVDRPDQFTNDTFLQLLVAQMRYQDPDNPASASDMMNQTAMFSQVQTMQQMVQQNTEMLALQRALQAGSLAGHAVSYTDTDGTTKSGFVSSVRIDNTKNTSVAVINGNAVDIGRITEVGPSASQPASAS
jgi:flagellar basal-body rod modification protein FlgD